MCYNFRTDTLKAGKGASKLQSRIRLILIITTNCILSITALRYKNMNKLDSGIKYFSIGCGTKILCL